MTGFHESGWDDAAVLEVLSHLRPEDVRECEATMGAFDPWALHATQRAAMPTAAYFGVFRTRPLSPPLAIAGVWRRWPGNGTAHLLARPGFEAIALPVLRHLRRVVAPLLAREFRRIDAQADARNAMHLKLIRRFGAQEETPMPGYGRDGEAFVNFVWYPQETPTPEGD